MAWTQPTTDSSQQPKKPLIHVLLPHRDNWHAEWVEATWKPLCQPSPWCEKIFNLCRIPSLPNARNTLAKIFLEGNAEYALWIDHDHVVEKPTVKIGEDKDGKTIEVGDINLAAYHLYRALEQSGESIVTALYRAKQQHGFNYAIWNHAVTPEGKPSFVHVQNWEPLTANFFAVDVAGMGMMMMRRRVLEAMRGAGYGTDEKPFFHWEHPDSMSEDFDFLVKAAKLGYKTWCLADVRLSHMGDVVIESTGNVRVPRV
jgi:hypothetical protein